MDKDHYLHVDLARLRTKLGAAPSALHSLATVLGAG
jgi:hypothetical protein